MYVFFSDCARRGGGRYGEERNAQRCERDERAQRSDSHQVDISPSRVDVSASSPLAAPTAPGSVLTPSHRIGNAATARCRRECHPARRPTTPRTFSRRLAVDRGDQRDDQDRDDVRDLDHRVDRGAGRVLVGVADGVARDRRGVGLRALAAEARRPRSASSRCPTRRRPRSSRSRGRCRSRSCRSAGRRASPG